MNKPVILPFEKRTVFTAVGVGDLGFVTAEIAAAIGMPAGTIKLLNGVEGRKGGYGRVHIEAHAQRMKQISGLGYRDVVSYVHFVSGAFERIARQENDRLLFLRHSNSLHHQVICQWDAELTIWSVTTAFPKAAVRDLDIVWERSAGG